MNINEKLLKEIVDYCNFNNIKNIDEEINKYIRVGFNITRFGTAPFKPLQEEQLPLVEEEKKPKKKTTRTKKVELTQVEEVKKEEEIVTETVKKKPKIRIIKND